MKLAGRAGQPATEVEGPDQRGPHRAVGHLAHCRLALRTTLIIENAVSELLATEIT